MKRWMVLNLCLSVLVFSLCGCTSVPASESSTPVTTNNTAQSTHQTTHTTTTTTQNTTDTSRISTNTTTSRATSVNTNSNRLNVPILHQFPEFPSGCESVSAVMALQYYGENISVTRFVQKHLEMSNNFYYENGKHYGPSPYQYFIGNPASTQSYGCMAPVIEKALISYFGTNNRVKNTTGTSLKDLCRTYIDQGEPVLVWATIGMIETTPGSTWYLKDGTQYVWPNNEHCMVLVGYDDTRYYFNDPYRGMVKSYPHWLCDARYKDLGMQSIAITR